MLEMIVSLRRIMPGVLAFMFMLLLCPQASAHSIRCFASADGATISGYAWFGGGKRVLNVPYRAEAPDGTVLQQGQTNDNGEFSFTVKVRCDILVVVDAGSGHVARFTVKAASLPASLPEYGKAADAAQVSAPAPAVAKESDTAEAGAVAAAPVAEAELARLIAREVRAQIEPLRGDLEEYKEAQGMRDIIGGIGYLVGVCGIAFYFLGVRRQERRVRCGGEDKPGQC